MLRQSKCRPAEKGGPMGKFDGMLLVSDYDDTFCPYGLPEPPAANRGAAEYFMAEGGRFTIATGRPPRSYLAVERTFTVNAPVILCNGVVLFDSAARENIYEGFLPFTSRRDLPDVLADFPEYGMEVHRGTEVLVVRRNSGVEAHLAEIGAEIVMADAEKIPCPWTFACFCSPLPLGEESDRTRALARALTDRYPGRYEAVPSGGIIDVSAKGHDKGSGLRRLAEYMGMGQENIFCVGDNHNDLPLLRAAARAFAPRDAIANVRREPGVITVGPSAGCLRDVVRCIEESL